MLHKLRGKKQIVFMVLNLSFPPVIVYNTFKELVSLSVASNVPNTQAQIFNIGVEVIQKNQDFETCLSKWFEHPAVENMWQVFKSNFTDAHNALKLIYGPTAQYTIPSIKPDGS